MDRIRTDTKTHVLTERVTVLPDLDGKRKARTLCGRVVSGFSGVGTAQVIDCEACKRSLRKDGWLV